ncbi:MAG: hypothetical protein C4B59_10500 [Candidatus Methanogaster sp.]|uniref:Uncharacterized protein n=1 Tax=Candidatus Methanogaster sp. TaxID=3386292 RepID=A0AC61L1P6_9EURY|nr:MAG: hypothetical protein C4B59_10500 [ANME-2 cluster archaeon]
MKQIIIILLLTLTNVVCAETAPEETWNKTFGGASTERAWSVQQTSDGGYIFAGDTRSYGAGGSDFFGLLKQVPMETRSGIGPLEELAVMVHRAFTGLVDAGRCRMRWIEGAGMVVERVVG